MIGNKNKFKKKARNFFLLNILRKKNKNVNAVLN